MNTTLPQRKFHLRFATLGEHAEIMAAGIQAGIEANDAWHKGVCSTADDLLVFQFT